MIWAQPAARVDEWDTMAVCPFSRPDTVFHNLVRRLARALPRIAPALVWADDVVYGRPWKR